jgi:hypothetical protein
LLSRPGGRGPGSVECPDGRPKPAMT